MIKIFLLNIVIAVFYVNTVESGVNLQSGRLDNVAVCNQLYNSTTGTVICKNDTVTLPDNNSHSSGIPVKQPVAKFQDTGADKISFLSNTFRNKFKFFETGVSPPVRKVE